MGTLVFLAISLVLLFFGKRKVSLLMFCAMGYDYFKLLPLSVMQFNGIDAGIIYMVVASIIFYGQDWTNVNEDKKLKKRVILFAVFLMSSIFFSLFHYHLSPSQVFMGSRLHFIVLAYFFLRTVTHEEVSWLVRMLYYITFCHSIVFILQFITQVPLLGEPITDLESGRMRFLNSPTFNIFFLVLTMFYPDYIGKKIAKWSPIVFFIALLCSLGRTLIIVSILVVFLGFITRKREAFENRRKIAAIFIFVIVAAFPLYNVVSARLDAGGRTREDIVGVISGNAVEMARTGEMGKSGSTFTYRIAWILERAGYMLNSSISESAFGLGFYAPKDNKAAYDAYHFSIGLTDEDGYIYQLATPDISYGNMLTQFGFLGSIIYLLIWIRLLVISFKKRTYNPLAHSLFLFLIFIFFVGFVGSNLSTVSYLIFPFIIVSTLCNDKAEEIREEPYRITKYL